MIGTIIKVIEDKGYAFLIDEFGVNRFLHFSNFVFPLVKNVEVGDTIIFTPSKNNEHNIAIKACLVDNDDIKFKASNHEQVLKRIKIGKTLEKKAR